MITVQTHAATVIGTRALEVSVEASPADGDRLEITGASNAVAREIRVRVLSALQRALDVRDAAGVRVRLLPVDLRKSVASLDLAVAVAVYASTHSVPTVRLDETLFFGELSLDGRLRCGRGLIPQLLYAKERGLGAAVVPFAQLREAGLVKGIEVYGASNLADVVQFLDGRRVLATPNDLEPCWPKPRDLPAIRGLEVEQRALKIAAAGGHHVLLIGRIGVGKTMLARRVPGWMAPLTEEEALEVATVYSTAGLEVRYAERLFRAPHHTASAAAILGGGDPIRPGEMTLAHNGVLFLDDLPEFGRQALDTVLLAMQGDEVTVVRSGMSATMPARALVVGAMAPCPCGMRPNLSGTPCSCPPQRVAAYRGRVPLEAFDMHVGVGMDFAAAPRELDDRALRVARTIAGLKGRSEPSAADVEEAMSYRVDWETEAQGVASCG